MAMDWANEEYVRLYTRETADDLELSWEALAVWRAILEKFDRAGLIPVRNGWSSVALLIRMPVDVVVRVGPELVVDGRVRFVEGAIYAPNFTEAQTASKSDKARQRESRDRRRDSASSQPLESTQACHDVSQPVTPSHTPSRNVTLPLLCSALPPVTLPPVAEATRALAEPKTRARRKPSVQLPEIPLPADWQPTGEHHELARTRGLDIVHQAQTFRSHADTYDRRAVRWNGAFTTWLLKGRVEPRSASGLTPLEQQFERVRMLEAQDAEQKALP